MLKTQIKNIAKYLTEVRKIPKEGFSFIFGEMIEYRTRIYLPPKNAGFENLDWEKWLDEIKSQTQKLKNTVNKSTKQN